MISAERSFKKELPASNLVNCNLVGADLRKVLKRHADNEQYVMNKAICEINYFVFKNNIEKKLWAPDMASPVHRKINGVNKSFYNHMANDGLHLGEDLRKSWAKIMLKTATKYQ